MSSMIKNVFTYVDLFFGYLTSALMRVILYGLSAICTLSAVLFVLVVPFEGNFDLNELDTLELLVLAFFVLVSVRFFKRRKQEGITLWSRIKSYCSVSIFLSLLALALGCIALVIALDKERELGASDLTLSLELTYFTFSMAYILTLYAFTPLPKISWFSNSESGQIPLVASEAPKDNSTATTEDNVFFTDSTGSTYTSSTYADNKQ